MTTLPQGQPTPSGQTTPDPQELRQQHVADSHVHDTPEPAEQQPHKVPPPQPMTGRKVELSYYDDPRDAIEDAIDAQTHDANAKAFADWTDPSLRFGQDRFVSAPAPVTDPDDPDFIPPEPEAQPAPEPQAAPQPAPTGALPRTRQAADGETEFLMMVDGQAQYVRPGATISSSRSEGQGGEAQRALAEANRTLAEARALHERITSGSPPPAAPGTSREPEPPTSPSAGKKLSRTEISHALQYGTDEESALAQEQLVAEAQAAGRVDPNMIRQMIREEFGGLAYERSVERAEAEQIPETARSNKFLGAALREATRDAIRDDLASIVMRDQGWDEQRARSLVDEIPEGKLEEAHKAFALKGHQVRQPAEILTAARSKLPQGWMPDAQNPAPANAPAPAPAPTSFPIPRAQRTEGLPPQPAPRVSPPRTENVPQVRNQTNAEIIAEERTSRGFAY